MHVIVRSSTGLSDEIQLRTAEQNIWASLSEAAAARFGIDVKYGGGPIDLREFLDFVSRVIALSETVYRSALTARAELDARLDVADDGGLREDLAARRAIVERALARADESRSTAAAATQRLIDQWLPQESQ